MLDIIGIITLVTKLFQQKVFHYLHMFYHLPVSL